MEAVVEGKEWNLTARTDGARTAFALVAQGPFTALVMFGVEPSS